MRAEELAAARAEEAGKAEDLAGAELEADVVDAEDGRRVRRSTDSRSTSSSVGGAERARRGRDRGAEAAGPTWRR